MKTTQNTPTLRLSKTISSVSLPGEPAMYKFEIPLFEGWKPSNGKQTSCDRKILTRQDAICLIIDYLSRDGYGLASHVSDIRQLLRQWDCQRTMTHACSMLNDWTSTYFNSCYGFVGCNFQCESISASTAMLCSSKSRKTLWYRTGKGIYALTRIGIERAKYLKTQAYIANLAAQVQGAAESSLPHCPPPIVKKYTIIGRITAPDPRSFTLDLVSGMTMYQVMVKVGAAEEQLRCSTFLTNRCDSALKADRSCSGQAQTKW